MRLRLSLALIFASALAAPAALAQPKPRPASGPTPQAPAEPDAGKADPAKADAGKADPAKAGPSKADPTKADLARIEAQKAQAARAAQRLAEQVKRGTEACEVGELDEGLAALSSAWSQKADPDIAAALATCEMKARRFPAAAEHLAAALRVKEDGPDRKRLEEMFLDARKRVGALKLSANIEGADVLVGSRYVGQTPLPGEVYLEPDVETLVVVKKTGHDEVERRVKVGAQRVAELKVELGAVPPGVNRYGYAERTRVPFFVLGGLALVAGGVGAALYSAAFTKASAADDILTSIQTAYPSQTNACSPTRAGCDIVRDLRKGRDLYMNVGTGVFIGGGVLLGAAVLTGVWTFAAPSTGRSASVRLTPSVSREGGGLLLQGAF